MSQQLATAAFGRTGLNVTRLGYGAMEVRGSRIWGGRPCSEEQAERILHAVLDAGINFIDTSNDYGRSEEFIGRFLAKRRDEYVLTTKCGCTVVRRDENTDDTPHVWTRANLLRCLHESLERLQTDVIDVMLLHNPSVQQIQDGDLVAVLQEMKTQGKVKHIGCSTRVPELPAVLPWDVFEVMEIPYSALERQHENWITAAAQAGVGIIVRGGVARGEPGLGLGGGDRWQPYEAAKLDELKAPDENRTQFMLRYTLTHPHSDTIIVGTLQPEHLAENVAAVARGPLSSEDYAEVKRRLDAVGQGAEPAVQA